MLHWCIKHFEANTNINKMNLSLAFYIMWLIYTLRQPLGLVSRLGPEILIHIKAMRQVQIVHTVQHFTVVQTSCSKREIDLHLCQMSTSWSGDLGSCQSPSDLHTSNHFQNIFSRFIFMSVFRHEDKLLGAQQVTWTFGHSTFQNLA